MFERILVPLDGTAESNVALPIARTLARQTGGSITLLQVVSDPFSLGERMVFDEATEALAQVAHELSAGGIHVEVVVRRGEVVHELLRQSRIQAADLIVMRTHGRAGLGRAVLGSTTQRVLSESGVPVLVLRSGGRRVTRIRRLLVPLDGSPGGACALDTAVGLAKATGAAIKLVQDAVPVTVSAYAGYPYGGLSYFDPAWHVEALASARTYLDGIASSLSTSGVDVEFEACQAPDVAETIVAVADRTPTDVIVMSTQALMGPARALLGSVADAVVRSAHCPVLLVHRAEEEKPTIPDAAKRGSRATVSTGGS